jgi:RHS repeat-associated protein
VKGLSSRSLADLIPTRLTRLLVLAVSVALLAVGSQLIPLEGVGDWGDDELTSDKPVTGQQADAQPRPEDTTKKAAVRKLASPQWPAGGSVEVALGGKAEAGGLPVAVSSEPGGKSPEEVRVTNLGRKTAERLGVAAVLNVSRADGGKKAQKVGLTVDYSAFAEAYGGSYGSRLRLVQLPECAATAEPGTEECRELPRPLKSRNTSSDRVVSASVTASPAADGMSTQTAKPASLVALAAGPSSDKGDYKATKLSPSAEWNVSKSSGGFSWNYPFRTVPVPGGLAPSIALGYSSQAIDGQTSVTNTQGSWIGEGFGYEPGYIERSYKRCAEDGHESSAEQCWAHDNATILLNGSSSQLIKDDDTGDWHLTGENGAKVEKLTGATNGDDNGEHWRVTTTDGTEYYYGLNRLPGWSSGEETTSSTWTAPVFGDDSGEPCYDSTFSQAHCKQAWRWNLDYVKDTHGNVMSYFYGAETNHYALNGKTDVDGTPYHRGGYLERVDYGQRHNEVYSTPAPARVKFTVKERCLPTSDFDCAPSKRTTANATHWPDVPVDLQCKAGTHCDAGQAVASFWTTKRLTAVTTQMRTDSGYTDVDAWLLEHRLLDNGDDSKSLWLHSITHEGRAGDEALATPSVTLGGTAMPNRVDEDGDNIDAFHRYRLDQVLSETGAQLDINYAPTDCTATDLPEPGRSTKRCYPVKWAPPGHIEPITDWFHKYVVAEIVQTDRTGGGEDMITRYDYNGPAGWRHAKPNGITPEDFLTWGQWQGYGDVTVTSGGEDAPRTRIDYTFVQGLDGDKDPDGGTRSATVTDSTGKTYTGHEEYTGFQVEAQTYLDGEVVAKSINEPWKHVTATQTKSWDTSRATVVASDVTRGYTKIADGTWRETKSVDTYDTETDTGRLVRTDDLGDLSTTEDDSCTRLWYADNPDKNIYDLPSRSEAVSVRCGDTPDRETEVLDDQRVAYDGGAVDDAPTKGDVTSSQRLTGYTDGEPQYQSMGTTTYDAYGRPTAQTDAAGATGTMTYTQTNGLTTESTVTNTLGHEYTTVFAPAWGKPTVKIDANGRQTQVAYDGFGRVSAYWLADRQRTQTPSIKYSYLVRQDKPVAIKTEKVENNGDYGTEWKLYDSLLRPRQEQTEGPDGTRMVADVFYGSTGKVTQTSATYNATGAPSSELLVVEDGRIESQTAFEYDALGRQTATVAKVFGVEQWRTTQRHEGDRVHTDPPTGGTPTTTVTDAAGQMVELRHWRGDKPGVTGPDAGYTATEYTYTPSGQLETVTDSDGNVWTYKYDQLDRKIESIDPDSGTTTVEYNELDQPVSTTDARGETISTVYDDLGRPLSTWEGAPNSGTKLTETRYDKQGLLGVAWANFRYTDTGDYFATVIQTFNTFYQPVRTTYSVPESEGDLAGYYSFTTGYNSDGTVRSYGMPAAGGLQAEPIGIGYDELHRPVSMSGKTSYVDGVVYDDLSQLRRLQMSATDGPSISQTFHYEDGTQRLKKSEVEIDNAAGIVKAAHYSYDQAGNVLSISDTAGTSPDVQCFAYDSQQRLNEAWTPAATTTSATGSGTLGGTLGGSRPAACSATPGETALGGPAPYWTSWSVDAIGNRTEEVRHDVGLDPAKDITRTYTYGENGAGPHAVTSIRETEGTITRGSTYSYDATGNTTERVVGGNTQQLTWNSEGKLTKTVEADGAEATYLYDAGGNRIVRRDAQGTTVYLPGMELHQSKGEAGVKATRYYSFAGQTIAVRTDDGKLSFLAGDHHGTAQLAIDGATGSVNQRRMMPYGNSRGTEPVAWPGEKGFVGGTIDKQTGLTHIGAREYDPELGKFISVDPVIDYTNPQQVNGYAYANNSPVTLSDPTGMITYECREGLVACTNGVPDVEKMKNDTGDEESNVGSANDALNAAQGALQTARQTTSNAIKGLADIALELTGIDAPLDCLSTGDLGACAETALMAIGGLGFVAKAAGKIVVKYLFNFNKGRKLIKRVSGLIDDLMNADKYIAQAERAVASAKKGVAKAKDKLAKARAKIKASKKKKGNEETAAESCEVNSFESGTLVSMADGTSKPIEQVKLGDKVLATDPETGETSVETVTAEILGQGTKHLVKVSIDATSEDGDETGTKTVTATDGHPFWVEGPDEWTDATDLQRGDWLRTGAGTLVQVTAVERWTQQATVHNLTVTDLHTYYVLAGATPVLVHNCNEVFYRAMSEKEFNQLGTNGEITVRGTENFVTQDREYLEGLRHQTHRRGGRNAEKYTVLVRFEMSPGTRDALIAAGKRPGEIGQDVNAVHLKSERGFDTYGLRPGSVGVFNSRIVGFGRVADW